MNEWFIGHLSQRSCKQIVYIYTKTDYVCLHFTFNAFIRIVCIVYVCMMDVSYVINVTITKTKILLFIKYWCMEFSSLKQISIFKTLLKSKLKWPGPKISSYFIIRVSHIAFLYESKTTQTTYLVFHITPILLTL